MTTLEADATSPAEVAGATHVSLRRQTLRRFLRHRLAVLGALLLLGILLIAAFAPLAAPQSPTFADLKSVRQPPSAAHWLGTDQTGRDVWARLVYGARTSLTVGFGAVAVYVLLGT